LESICFEVFNCYVFHILMKFLIWLLLADKFSSISFLLSWVLLEVDSKCVQCFSWLIVNDCVFFIFPFFFMFFYSLFCPCHNAICFCNIICFGNVTIVSTTTLVFYVVPLVNATMINAQTLVDTLSSKVVYLSQEFFQINF
jgi:hypothetical protein